MRSKEAFRYKVQPHFPGRVKPTAKIRVRVWLAHLLLQVTWGRLYAFTLGGHGAREQKNDADMGLVSKQTLDAVTEARTQPEANGAQTHRFRGTFYQRNHTERLAPFAA